MTAFGAVLSFRSQALFLDVMVLKADQALLWLGRYTVLLHAIYGDAGETLDARSYIWVVPWRTQGWKALLVILFIAFVVWKRRNFGMAWYFLRTGLPPPQDL